MRFVVLAVALVLAPPAAAQEFIETRGKLSDDDFYRIVACAAPPGGECQKPMVKWARQGPIRVTIQHMDDVYLGGKRLRAFAALERAIQAINGAEAGVRLVEVDRDNPAEIEIYFNDQERGEPIAGTGIAGVDGSPLGGASTRVLFDRDKGEVLRVAIIFSTTLQIRAYESAMLEELTQAMGLMTDIRNPFYEETSVFSQDSNAAITLGEQDIMALKRHYGGAP